MINKGDIYLSSERAYTLEPDTLVQVERTYNKRDIDPECPMSVAIVPMVEVTVLTGRDIGRKLRWDRKVFRKKFERPETDK